MTNRKKFEIFQGLTVPPSGPRVPRGRAAGGGIQEVWDCAPETLGVHQVCRSWRRTATQELRCAVGRTATQEAGREGKMPWNRVKIHD